MKPITGEEALKMLSYSGYVMNCPFDSPRTIHLEVATMAQSAGCFTLKLLSEKFFKTDLSPIVKGLAISAACTGVATMASRTVDFVQLWNDLDVFEAVDEAMEETMA